MIRPIGRLLQGAALFLFLGSRKTVGTFALFTTTLLLAQDAAAVKSQQAKQFMGAGKFAEAITIYEDLVKAMPTNQGLRLNLGMAQHMAGRDREAVATLGTQKDPRSLAMCGVSYMRLGDASKAADYLESAVRAMPDDVELARMLAEAGMVAERPKAVATAFRTIVKAQPEVARGWLELGRSYETMAEEAYAKLDAQAQGSPYWLALVAETRMKQQQLRGALALYREALGKLDRRDWHERIAEIYEKSDHKDWAAEERKKSPPATPCLKPTAECHFQAKRYLAATEVPITKSPDAEYWRSKAYNELAREAFARLSKFPDSSEWHEFLGTLYRNQGKHAEAMTEWRAALDKRPDDPQLAKELSTSLLANKDFVPAEMNLRGLLRKAPEDAELLWLLGDALAGQQKMDEAIEPLEKAAKLAPQVLPVRASLGRALMTANRAADAIAHLDAALPIDRDGSLHFQLSRALQSTGNTDRVAELVKKSQELRRRIDDAEQAGEITPPK